MDYIPIFDPVVHSLVDPVVDRTLDRLRGVVCHVQEIRSHDEQREGQDAPSQGIAFAL